MSKIKDQMERDHEHEMEQYYSFMEWVCDQQQEESESEATSEVEEDSKEPSTSRTSIVPAYTLNSVNNIDYNPCKGA